jgi:hypothetical protein
MSLPNFSVFLSQNILHQTTGISGMIIMIAGKSQAFLSSSAVNVAFLFVTAFNRLTAVKPSRQSL